MGKFEDSFNRVLQEDVTTSDALGSSPSLKGGSVGNGDTYATGELKIPMSLFGVGRVSTRDGLTKKKKKKKKKEENEEKIEENYADGKKKGKSKPGRVKQSGASCKGTVAELRKRAKKYGGEKGKMYHWCANMKSGRKKSESEEVVSEDTGADTNWIDGDVEITLSDVLKYSSKPLEKDPRAFEGLLINVSRDQNRIDQADLSYPIVVSTKGGIPTKILDGQHRIKKAIKYKQPILVKYLDLDRAPEHFQQMFN